MEFIADIIPLVKIAFVFSITVLLQQKFMPIGAAFLSGVLILQLWFPRPWANFFHVVLESISSGQTISITMIVILIVALSNSLKATGHFDRIVYSIKNFLASHRKSTFILPAFVGLLPMPGGAIFSAPMVEEITKDTDMPPSRKAASNHWFRHVWEYVWPLYPGILMAANRTGLSLIVLITFNLPFTVLAILTGFLFIAPKKHFAGGDPEESNPPGNREMFISLFPVLIVVCCFLLTSLLLKIGTSFFYADISSLIRTLPGPYAESSPPSFIENSLLIFSIISGILFVAVEYPNLKICRMVANKRILSMAFMIIALLLFQDVLRSSDAVDSITSTFIKWNFPIALLAAVLPFIIGLVTGITVGFVAGAFPIIIPLIIGSGNAELMLPYIVLGFVFGFMGVLLSPLHVCLVLTVKHFSTSLDKALKHMLIPALIIMAWALIEFAVLIMIM